MTTELEKQFFECFGIESLGKMDISQMTISVDDEVVIEGKDLPNNKYNIFPPITDRKLLELENIILKSGLYLCLKSNRNDYFEYIIFEKTKEKGFCARYSRIEALLQLCINIQNGYTSHKQEINYKRDIKQQVKALFEGE